VAQFERGEHAKLVEKERRKTTALLDEIREVINAKAKSASYSLVLDIAGESATGAPTVLYTNGENDLTETILNQLNAAAPAATTSETKPDEKKKDKK